MSLGSQTLLNASHTLPLWNVSASLCVCACVCVCVCVWRNKDRRSRVWSLACTESCVPWSFTQGTANLTGRIARRPEETQGPARQHSICIQAPTVADLLCGLYSKQTQDASVPVSARGTGLDNAGRTPETKKHSLWDWCTWPECVCVCA